MTPNEPLRAPRVRPQFLRGAAIALLLLLPFVAHALWDYVETRRLRDRGDAILAKQEPVSRLRRADSPFASDGERYYRAAAAMAADFSHDLPRDFLTRVSVAETSGTWPPDLVDQVAAVVARFDTALTLGARAADLPFDGFHPAPDVFVIRHLVDLYRLTSLRTDSLALAGNADAAADTLRVEASLGRDALGQNYSSDRLAIDLKTVFDRSGPSNESLARLAGVVAALDRDDRPCTYLQQLQAEVLDRARPLLRSESDRHRQLDLQLVIERPWRTHVLIDQLDRFRALLDACRAPWPRRIDAMIAAGKFPVDRGVPDRDGLTESVINTAAEHLAFVRAARVVIAVEQFRREHNDALPTAVSDLRTYLPADPLDPFSGQSLRLKAEANGYVVYSVGLNRRDDNGEGVGTIPLGKSGWPQPTFTNDLGIRISRR